MSDRYARWAPEAHVDLVPPWAGGGDGDGRNPPPGDDRKIHNEETT